MSDGSGRLSQAELALPEVIALARIKKLGRVHEQTEEEASEEVPYITEKIIVGIKTEDIPIEEQKYHNPSDLFSSIRRDGNIVANDRTKEGYERAMRYRARRIIENDKEFVKKVEDYCREATYLQTECFRDPPNMMILIGTMRQEFLSRGVAPPPINERLGLFDELDIQYTTKTVPGSGGPLRRQKKIEVIDAEAMRFHPKVIAFRAILRREHMRRLYRLSQSEEFTDLELGSDEEEVSKSLWNILYGVTYMVKLLDLDTIRSIVESEHPVKPIITDINKYIKDPRVYKFAASYILKHINPRFVGRE